MQLRQQTGHDLPGPGVARRTNRTEQGDQVVAYRLAGQPRQLALQRGHRVDQQPLLVGPPPVDRRLAHAGLRRDRLDRERLGRRAVGQQVQDGLDDRLIGPGTARPTGSLALLVGRQ